MLSRQLRETFDGILADLIDALPPGVAELLDEVPIIVEDEPDERAIDTLDGPVDDADLYGLYEGTALTDRGVEDTGMLPTQILLFRGPIIRLAQYRVAGGREVNRDELVRQVHITLMHEIGHHFGLDEDDLAGLGYD